MTTTPTMKLDERQIEAIDMCLNSPSRIVAVRGAAGTGKTTIERNVYEALQAAGHQVTLCAPTGKAAKRIEEATGVSARTIHRLLEFGMPIEDEESGKPTSISLPNRHARRPLEYSVVIADEYSMVNSNIHSALVAAMPRGSRLLVFGDTNQLRPIEENYIKGAPTPFETLLKKFPSVTLDKVHRQEDDSGILANAHRVLRRLAPRRYKDFEITVTEKQVDTVRAVVAEDKSWASLSHQIITPQNKSSYGTHALNSMIQTLLEPEVGLPSIQPSRWEYDKKFPITVRVGTKVIQGKNNYNLGVFNGETGIVVRCDPSTRTFAVDFGDRVVEYPERMEVQLMDRDAGMMKRMTVFPQRDIYLAYAVTTHKSQGSEFDKVMYVMSRSMWFSQNRANLYTAITRAKQHVLLITDNASLTGVPLREE